MATGLKPSQRRGKAAADLMTSPPHLRVEDATCRVSAGQGHGPVPNGAAFVIPSFCAALIRSEQHAAANLSHYRDGLAGPLAT
jgi:hypothetical protein